MRGLAMTMVVVALLGCEAPATDLVIPLAVVNWYPSGNATCVPRETGVWVSFSEPVAVDTLTDESVGLFHGVDALPVTRTYDGDTWTVQLVPDDLLDFEATYDVRLQPDIASEAGGSFRTEVISTFSTLPQTGCASSLACHVDADCHPQLCSVTGACVDECAVPEDCPAGQICVADVCQE